MQTLDWLYAHRSCLLLEVISGSRAYGLHTPQSDMDIKGIYILPKNIFYGWRYAEQISNAKSDIVYYELKRFMELLMKNNPTILELLYTPEESVIYKHPCLDDINPGWFLSKLCRQSFAGYAEAQIKKARGLNKKIVNPFSKEKKSMLDFCYVQQGAGSIPLSAWLHTYAYLQQDCGLSAIPHFRDVYALFHSSQGIEKTKLRGVFSGDESQEVLLSSIPPHIDPLCIVHVNKDGYSTYCKEYKDYWNWVEVRNEERYQGTLEHGKNYDAKNMMHVFRLLTMAEEIARHKRVIVHRHDRDFLLKIRRGEFGYEYLLQLAEEKMSSMNELFDKSDLPEEPDWQKAEELLWSIRNKWYSS
ncbi:MAG: nucleotidyltransferase domain-containing protein [Cytophagaceae bacterium]|jgi:predicted nucleotidyltransferase|nr:nucleotidyltransferase domain-containing protein [Cytophagaceae bacterium]